jgi:hypothetical protein
VEQGIVNLTNVFPAKLKFLAPTPCLQVGHTTIMRYVRMGSNKAKKYLSILLLVGLPFAAWAQQDKKTDDDKPADPDTGESTVEEKTLGILPNPLAKYGVKFAATYIGEVLGNVSGGLKQGAITRAASTLLLTSICRNSLALTSLPSTPTCFRFMARVFREIIFRTFS